MNNTLIKVFDDVTYGCGIHQLTNKFIGPKKPGRGLSRMLFKENELALRDVLDREEMICSSTGLGDLEA